MPREAKRERVKTNKKTGTIKPSAQSLNSPTRTKSTNINAITG